MVVASHLGVVGVAVTVQRFTGLPVVSANINCGTPVIKLIVSTAITTPFFEVVSFNLQVVSIGAVGETEKSIGVVVVKVPRDGTLAILTVPEVTFTKPESDSRVTVRFDASERPLFFIVRFI